MNFVADESVDKQIVDKLRSQNHSIWFVAEMSPSISDEDVLKLANHKKAPLITADKDFGELVFRQHLLSYGVILIRLSGLSAERKMTIVSKAITVYGAEIINNFTVISPNRIRIRKVQNP